MALLETHSNHTWGCLGTECLWRGEEEEEGGWGEGEGKRRGSPSVAIMAHTAYIKKLRARRTSSLRRVAPKDGNCVRDRKREAASWSLKKSSALRHCSMPNTTAVRETADSHVEETSNSNSNKYKPKGHRRKCCRQKGSARV
jgi:hypothetical protein